MINHNTLPLFLAVFSLSACTHKQFAPMAGTEEMEEMQLAWNQGFVLSLTTIVSEAMWPEAVDVVTLENLWEGILTTQPEGEELFFDGIEVLSAMEAQLDDDGINETLADADYNQEEIEALPKNWNIALLTAYLLDDWTFSNPLERSSEIGDAYDCVQAAGISFAPRFNSKGLVTTDLTKIELLIPSATLAQEYASCTVGLGFPYDLQPLEHFYGEIHLALPRD